MNYTIGAYIVGLGLIFGYGMWLCVQSIAISKREKRQQRRG